MRAKALLLMAVAVAVAGCSKQVAPTSYHDCVLSHTANTTASPDAVAAAKSACKGLFPPKFDWGELSSRSKTIPWPEVAAGKDFQKLTDDEKGIVRAQYFERVIRPYIHSDMIEDARRMFEVEAKLSASSSMTPR